MQVDEIAIGGPKFIMYRQIRIEIIVYCNRAWVWEGDIGC